MKLINLEQARNAFRSLGEGVAVCLEPDAAFKAKTGTPKEQELWYFDPETGRTRRGDGKFFDIRWADRGGYGHPEIFQEPNLPDPPEGEPRIVGHVILELDRNINLHVRRAKGLNGPTLELKPSSISKGELAAAGCQWVGLVQADPQRIGGGFIEVFLHGLDVEFPVEESCSMDGFEELSTDGRSLAALAKVRAWRRFNHE